MYIYCVRKKVQYIINYKYSFFVKYKFQVRFNIPFGYTFVWEKIEKKKKKPKFLKNKK